MTSGLSGVGRRALTADPARLDDLAREAARGDAAATEQLISGLATLSMGMARKLLGPAHPDVEDAAQESLIAVAASLPGYRGEGPFLGYATRIMVRNTLAVARRGRSRAERRESFQRIEVAPPSPTPGDMAQHTQRRELIRSLLGTLPPEQAETLALRVCLGASLEEVAEQTGVPVNTVRSRVRLAKEALRRRIVRTLGGGEP